jgi:tetratricopeptide (TPR) repeat protein
MRASGIPEQTPVIPTPPVEAPVPVTGIRPGSFLSAYDLLLGILVLIFAFLMASFVVRNPDFWQNLSTGRLIATGDYSFGKDPFCYTTADQTWVNASWLYDFGLYQIYRTTEGPGVVLVKALGIAFAMTCLLLLGRPGYSVLLMGSIVVIAVLAMAPFLVLRPVLASYVLTALFVGLLTKAETMRELAKPLPWILGGLTILWANMDAHAFLAPLILLSYALGKSLPINGQDGPTQLTKPLLYKALMLCLFATIINPHHIRSWLAIPETLGLTLPDVVANDREFSQLQRGLFDKSIFDFTGFDGGNPINAVAIVVLVGIGLLAFLVNFRRNLGGLLLLQLPLFGLSVIQLRLAPVWLISWTAWTAWNLGEAWLARLEKNAAANKPRPKMGGQVLSRMAFTVALVLLIVMSWPGWLNSSVRREQNARRVAWDVEIDGSLQRLGDRLKAIHESGKLPAESRGLLLHPEAAGYLSWIVPEEKFYVDGRISLHEPRLSDWIELRKIFSLQTLRQEEKHDDHEHFDWQAFMDREGITHVILGSRSPLENQIVTGIMLTSISEKGLVWDLWEVAGRTAVMGYRPAKTITPEQVKQLIFDPVTRTFGSEAKKLDDPIELKNIDIYEDPFVQLADRFFNPIPRAGAAIEEARMLAVIQEAIISRSMQKGQRASFLSAMVGGSVTLPFAPQGVTLAGENVAISLLAVREARQAILATPQLPEGYVDLAKAMQSNALPWPTVQRNLAVAVQLQRALLRAAPGRPMQRLSDSGRKQMFLGAVDLVNLHLQANRFDLAEEARRQAIEMLPEVFFADPREGDAYLKSLTDYHLGDPIGNPSEKPRINPRTGKPNPLLEDVLTQRITAYENEANKKDILVRSQIAQKYGLFREALRAVESIDLRSEKIPPQIKVSVVLTQAELLTTVGQVERAIELIGFLDEQLPDDMKNNPQFQQQLTGIKIRYATLVGKFQDAIELQTNQARSVQGDLAAFPRDMKPSEKLNVLPDENSYALSGMISQLLLPHVNPAQQIMHIVGDPVAYTLLSNQRQVLIAEATLQMRLGLLHLERGDNAEALSHFKASLTPSGISMGFDGREVAEIFVSTLSKK